MSAEQVAHEHYVGRRRLIEATAATAKQTWQQVDPDNITQSWFRAAPSLQVAVMGAQLAAASTADGYTDEALDEQDISPAASAAVEPAALVGIASDGRPLESLLLNAVITTKLGIAGGATVDRAMAAGYANLDMLVRTQVADAGRVADQLALVARPDVGGYVRKLVGKSCSRCVVLAGRRYRWNAGFKRHPRCDCIHVPANEAGDEMTTNPRQFFDGMSRAEQDREFTKAGAQAIREGGDIARVVNSRRGMYTAGGRQFTTEATTRAGINRRIRLMPEEIYQVAGNDRGEALRLLRSNGYLTDARPRIARPAAPKVVRPAPVREPIMQVPKQRVVPPELPAKPIAAGSSLERGIASGIRESRPLKGGEVGDVRLVTFNDGTQAIQKIAHKEFVYSPKILTDHEHLAGLVGRAIGAPIPEVIRTGETEVFMEYIAGTRPASAVFRKYKAAERGAQVSEFIDTREGRRLGLFDLLVANGDRHLGNWLVRKDGSIVGIDHGIAWPTGQITPEKIERSYPSFDGPFAGMYHEGFLGLSKPSRGWKANDLTDEDIRWVRDQLNALRPDFEAAGHGNWLDYSLARLRQLGAWAGGDVNQVKP